MDLDSPENNVYKVPYFFENKVVSDEMAQILVHMLHRNPEKRFKNLQDVKQNLLKLRKNIFDTPLLLRQVLGHPLLPNESLGSDTVEQVDFKGVKQS
jgi:serine/threonine protein kinase